MGLALALCGSLGCGPPQAGLYTKLQAEDPAVRLEGVIEAGQSQDPQAVPYLVDRLTDSEQDVRLFAILALERITGQTLGYRHYAPLPERLEAVRRWREWLEKQAHPAQSQPADQAAP